MTPFAEGSISRMAYETRKGRVVDTVPTDGIERLCDFLIRAGFCNRKMGSLEPFEPTQVLGWRDILDVDLSSIELREAVMLSHTYVQAANKHYAKQVEGCPYAKAKREYLE